MDCKIPELGGERSMNSISWQRLLTGLAVLSVLLGGTGILHDKLSRAQKQADENRAVQSSYESEGIYQFRQLRFTEAERLLLLADESAGRKPPSLPNGTAHAWLQGVYCATARYAKAAEDTDVFLALRPQDPDLLDKRNQYLLLEAYRESGAAAPLSRYLESYLERHREQLPPQAYNFSTPQTVSTVLRLYSVTGQHEKAIAFIDGILEHGFARDPKLAPWKGKITTSAEARSCAEGSQKGSDAQHDGRGCLWLERYLRLREAFQADQSKGFSGCFGAVPGEECLGEAGRELIRSDYFTW